MLALLLAGSASAGERCAAIAANELRCGREVVRVEGVDPDGGRQARQRLHQRVQSGEVVIQRRGRDKHGRTLGRLYVDGNRITQVDLTDRRRR
jgi:endonuclease YncB( thermonuclease family)